MADLRFAPGQHHLAGDRDGDRFGAEVARDGELAAVHDQPSPALVVVDGQVLQPGVGKVGFVVAQRDQLSVDLTQPAVIAVVDLVPVELGPAECLGVLRIGYLVGVPTVCGELRLAALGGGPCDLGLGV